MRTLSILAGILLLSGCTEYYETPTSTLWYIEDMSIIECDNAKGLDEWAAQNE